MTRDHAREASELRRRLRLAEARATALAALAERTVPGIGARLATARTVNEVLLLAALLQVPSEAGSAAGPDPTEGTP